MTFSGSKTTSSRIERCFPSTYEKQRNVTHGLPNQFFQNLNVIKFTIKII